MNATYIIITPAKFILSNHLFKYQMPIKYETYAKLSPLKIYSMVLVVSLFSFN